MLLEDGHDRVDDLIDLWLFDRERRLDFEDVPLHRGGLTHDAVLEQTQLTALPVIDDDGKLVGLYSAEESRPRCGDEMDASVADVMDAEPISFDEATTLPVLLDYFAREAPPVVVVVQKARPTGIVTPESLATLIQRLSTGSFAPLDECAGRSGLIVPNLCMAT